MKKFLASSLIFFTLTMANVFAIDVNEKELKSTGDEGTIVFENYSGPHAVIETIEAIKAIGSGLGNRLKANGLDKGATVGANEKYTVIHAVDETTGKLDADILIINSNATVDHIRNLRRIIGAYLSAAYGYNEKDAATVATFVTVYNAVYRQNLDAFKGKYKDIVTKNLTASKCGLSTKWSDWPGNSQIVIPLGEFADGGLSSVETSVISDKNVVNSMKEEDDKGIDERKNMVDIKEREADAASEKAQNAAKDASQEKKNLDEQKKVQKNAEKEAAAKKAEADKKQQEAAAKKAEADKA
ncbi:MAG: P83/100 family protein, partial [Spirochaetales bacterium]|nr:P83/100 family protein [Spirochaetales bacterium]